MEIDDILKRKCKRKSKTTKSLDTHDLYKRLSLDLRKRVSYKLFSKIVERTGVRMIDILFKTSDLRLPFRLGRLEIRKIKNYVKLVDGKVVTNRPTDWERTLELWTQDDEARLAHKKVKMDNQYSYKIAYRKDYVTFRNMWQTRFYTKRDVKLRLRDETSNNNDFDAYLNEQ